jgi:hypothetical protein
VGVKATKGAILTDLSILNYETGLNLTNFVNYIGFQWQRFRI